MSFPSTYHAIREMIRTSLLETHTTRDIVRKSGVRLSGSAPGSRGPSVDLLEQIARANVAGTNHSQYGYVVSFIAWPDPLPFPAAQTYLHRYGDFRDVTDIRLTANVTKLGPSGGALYLKLFQDVGTGPSVYPEISFAGGAPSVPVDSLGFHDSGWKSPLWLADPFEGRPAQIEPFLTNPPAVSGTLGVGLCQILLKRS